MAGVYIHIPFCESYCIYCGFYSELCSKKDDFDSYVMAIKKEIDIKKNFFGGAPISTIYFGGGTPSLLPLGYIKCILDYLRSAFEFQNNIMEITIEVNPDDINLEYALGLKSLGFNRISMGIQSFNDAHLKWMGRRHDAKAAINAYYILRDAGFENISLDLIFGYIPEFFNAEISKDNLDESWRNDVLQILKLAPEHISAYQLSVDSNSALDKCAYVEMGEEDCRRQYDFLRKTLFDAGYEHYEISNFARKGFESNHNSSYWNHESYLGLGASAHSYSKSMGGYGTRYWNPSDLKLYYSGMSENEVLTSENFVDELIMLGLRTRRGFNLNELYEYLSPLQKEKLSRNLDLMESKGLLSIIDGWISLSEDALFISDLIISSICPE